MEDFLNSMTILSSAILVYIFNRDIILKKILWKEKFEPRKPNGKGKNIYLYDARILGVILEGIRFRESTTPYGISEVRYRFLMFLGILLIQWDFIPLPHQVMYIIWDLRGYRR